MSHFSVIVATKDEPTDEVLSRELQPFHEFECTGIDDQYVQDVDKTAEAREEYSNAKTTRLRDGNGILHSPYDDQFYRDPTEEEAKTVGLGTGFGGGLSWTSKDWGDGRGYRAKVQFVPEGMYEIEVPKSQVQSFRDFVEGYYGIKPVLYSEKPDLKQEHKYGFTQLDASGDVIKVIDRTNPNAKWDYWRIGGRYAGKFQKKGRAPATRKDLSWEWKHSSHDERPTGVDICRKSDLDAAVMKAQAVESRRRYWAECMEKTGLSDANLVAAIHAHRATHAKWLELPEPRPCEKDFLDWSAANGGVFAHELGKLWDEPELRESQSSEDWIKSAPALTCFAFLMDGKWAAEGKMGWWASVSNANSDWQSDFMQIFETIPDDYWLTVVDCHI